MLLKSEEDHKLMLKHCLSLCAMEETLILDSEVTDHMRMLLSVPPDTKLLPSGEKHTVPSEDTRTNR